MRQPELEEAIRSLANRLKALETQMIPNLKRQLQEDLRTIGNLTEELADLRQRVEQLERLRGPGGP
jgi:hypothetical protein